MLYIAVGAIWLISCDPGALEIASGIGISKQEWKDIMSVRRCHELKPGTRKQTSEYCVENLSERTGHFALATFEGRILWIELEPNLKQCSVPTS